ncbi:hypothetical protein [Streptomyces lavendulocolor]|uniref:hypothetical protein n=1 Tax=Streptomyces lavendulocolor TaxID=67316 RepID=UPI003C2CDF36
MPTPPTDRQEPSQETAQQPSGRRVRRALARWTAVALAFAGAAAATAIPLIALDRSDVPGLATVSDGRWDYPALTLPALPSGSPLPLAEENEGNIHHADLRALLLPAPAGATPDTKLHGGWTSIERYVAEYEKTRRASMRQHLTDSALRHIAARGWTMPDGTKARVYLLRFTTRHHAERFVKDELKLMSGWYQSPPLHNAPDNRVDGDWDSSGAPRDLQQYPFSERAPYGAEQTRHAYVPAGDTIAFLVHEKKGGAAAVPFHQSMVLQMQLLA